MAHRRERDVAPGRASQMAVTELEFHAVSAGGSKALCPVPIKEPTGFAL